MSRAPEHGEPDPALNRFLRLYVADVAAGGARPLAEYQRRFPGQAEAIAAEYARLVGAAAPPGPEDPAAAFERAYLEDRAAGQVKPLSVYFERFPGNDLAIARRLTELEAGGEGDRPAPGGLPKEGGLLGPHRIERLLGTGGQGEVYEAWDTRLGRRVALKVLRGLGPASEEVLRRFEREASVTARLDHPGICAVYDTGVTGGVAWIAMQHVEGETLAARIRASRTSQGPELRTVVFEERSGAPPPPPPEPRRSAPHTPTDRARIVAAVKLIEEAARALHAAHEAGVIHRDVKPGNVMVTPEGRAVVLDFGLARMEEGDLPTLTVSGDLMGTPAYMSPEQLTGHRVRLDRRTDVYSLGVVLFECLTLERPFEAPTREALYQAILSKDPPDVRKLNRGVPDDLKVILETALEKDRDRRYQTAEELAEELRRLREREPIHARPVTRFVKLTRWAQRNPAVAASLIALIVVLLAGTTVSWIQTVQAENNLASWQRMSDVRLLRDLQQEAEEQLWPAWPEKADDMEDWLRRAQDLLSRREQHERTLAGLRARALPYTDDDRQEDRETHPQAGELSGLKLQLREGRKAVAALEEAVAEHAQRARKLAEASDGSPRAERSLQRAEQRLSAGRGALAKERGELEGLPARIAALESQVSERRTWRFREAEDQWRHEVFADLCRGLAGLADPDEGLVKEVEERLSFAKELGRRSLEEHREAWDAAIARVSADERFAGFELVPQMGLVPLGPDPDSKLEEFALYGQTGAVPERDAETGKLRITEETGLVLVLIPGGSFWMGAQRDPEKLNDDPQAEGDESPVHRVTLGPFLLSKWELTQGQWARFTGDNPSYWRPPETQGFEVTLRHPVEQVSWSDCAEVLPRLGLELPAEAQWEHACRAGTDTVWWCGDDVLSIQTERAGNIADLTASKRSRWTCTTEVEDGHVVHAPVGSFAANGFGLHDVLGNVREWCRDGYGSYELPARAGDGFRLVPGARDRVYRGGCFNATAAYGRSASRFRLTPVARNDVLGVRPARRITP